MSYPIITPPTLPNLLNAVVQDGIHTYPLDTEAANLLGSVDRQTRQFLYDFLVSVFASDSTLLPAAIAAASLAQKVQGGASNADATGRAITLGTVSTLDMRDSAVATAKIADSAVTTAKIADANVTTAKITDANVTTAKIASGAVGSTQIAAGGVAAANMAAASVATATLQDGAVTTVKLAANAVTVGKLAQSGGTGRLLVSDGSNNYQDVALSGDATLSSAGALTLVYKGTSYIVEQFANGVGAGNTAATTYNLRGFASGGTPPWQVLSDLQNLVSVAPVLDGKLFLSPGYHAVKATAPAYNGVGIHRTFITHYSAANAVIATVPGTNEVNIAGTTTTSIAFGVFLITPGQYIKITSYSQNAITNGLGAPSSLGVIENYATVEIHLIN